MKKFLREKWFVVAVTAISIALLINTLASWRNNKVISENKELQLRAARVQTLTDSILYDVVHNIDLGIRGYALTKKDKLLSPYHSAKASHKGIFKEVGQKLKTFNYPLVELNALQAEVENYFRFGQEMIDLTEAGNMEEIDRRLEEDRGYAVWEKFSSFRDPLFAHLKAVQLKASDEYDDAMRNNLIFQIVLLVLSVPLLWIIVSRVVQERAGRERLLKEVSENDRKLVFHPGTDAPTTGKEIINDSISNTRKASHLIKSMASGDYGVEWEGLTEFNRELNRETLAGDLVNMREKLKKVKAEDEKRNWMNEGLASFSELVRNHQHDSKMLADKCVSYLTKYLQAQQSSLFILTGPEEDQYLELASCYAFDKKKFIEKKIELGNGLVGQAFLEGETMLLKEVPKGYTEITSGLGDATPKFLVIVPLKYDIQTVAIIEMASFRDFEAHHVTFLQKAGEFLASAVLNSQNTQKMKALLDTAKINEEQMRQREEEMRQNMEELQATQEELVRKEKEMQKRLSDNRVVESNF